MPQLAIFNPDHDLCLANGSPSYMPPASALAFARQSAHLMAALYPDAQAVSLDQLRSVSPHQQIIPWGWNPVLKRHLQHLGAQPHQLPSDQYLHQLRSLQHRATTLPLQPDAHLCRSLADVEHHLHHLGSIVLKSPLSGSGRGLRFVRTTFAANDKPWIQRQLRLHQSLILEPLRQIERDIAFEYTLSQGRLTFVGYSLFDTQNGVYRGNILLHDHEIEQEIHRLVGDQLPQMRQRVEEHILATSSHYQGPLGVDLMITREPQGYGLHVAEVNYRHTMGLVAHQLLRLGLEPHATHWQVNP